jgi:site-specific recombinase XerD
MKNLININQDLILQKSIIEVIDDFLLSYNSIHTKKRYKTTLIEFFEYLNVNHLEELGMIHIADVTKAFDKHKLQKAVFFDEQKTKIKNTATINNIAYVIRAFFKYLINFYNYPKNPLLNYKPLNKKEHSTTNSLDRNELLDIIKQAKMDYLDMLSKSNNVKKHL